MDFKEEWLLPGAVVPIDVTTTRLLVEQLKTMLVTIGQIIVEQQPAAWVGLTDEEADEFHNWKDCTWSTNELVRHVEAKLKDKNT